MKSKRIFFPLIAAIFLSVVTGHVARAALCAKCREMMFTESQGRCIDCGGPTSSGALQLCPKCSAKRHQCEHCLAKLSKEEESAESAPEPLPGPASNSGVEQPSPPTPTVAGKPDPAPKDSAGMAPPWNGAPASPELPPAAPDRAVLPGPAGAAPDAALPRLRPIDPTRAGTYTAGKWQFHLQIADPGTRGEGRWGWLTYDGQKLPRGNINDYYNTPWGPMYWVGAEKTAWGLHGFMPIPSPQNPRPGRQLAMPASLMAAASTRPASAGKLQTLEINRSHNGQMARLRVGNLLIIRLPGDPASGYQWQVGTSNTQAVRLTVAPQYSPATIGSAGATAAGAYTFIYRAVQPGAGSLRLYYVRPNDRMHPRDVFAIGVQIAPAQVPRGPEVLH